MAFLAPDFLSTELSGKTQTANQMVSDLAALPKSLNPQERVTTVLDAKGNGKTEEVDQSYHLTKTKTDSAGVQVVV